MEIDRNKLILEMQRLSKELGKTPSKKDIKAHSKYKLNQYIKTFSTLTNAWKCAGLQPNTNCFTKKYSNEEILKEINRVAKNLNKTPTYDELNHLSKIRPRTMVDRFGSFNNAIISAGLVPHNYNVKEKEIIEEIVRISKKLGKTPSEKEFTTHSILSADLVKLRFGRFNKALVMAGLRVNIGRGLSFEDIKSEIERISKLLNKTPTRRELIKYSKTFRSIKAVLLATKSKTWNECLTKCGFEINHLYNIPDEDLIAEIKRLEKELDRLPGPREMREFGKYDPGAYSRKSGTYVKTLRDFGFDYVPTNQWKGQQYTKGKDGQIYRSKFEANIANILYGLVKNGTINNYEYEKRVCKERQWTCDFYLTIKTRKCWVEADGIENKRENPYNEDNEKIEYYETHGYDYLIIKYKDSVLNVINNFVKGTI